MTVICMPLILARADDGGINIPRRQDQVMPTVSLSRILFPDYVP